MQNQNKAAGPLHHLIPSAETCTCPHIDSPKSQLCVRIRVSAEELVLRLVVLSLIKHFMATIL